MSDSLNDIAWQTIFDEHQILNQVSADGFFFINSKIITPIREARLMTKFDHKSQLPKIFSDNNLSILPTSRGGYIISNIETFHTFEESDDMEINRIDFPNYLESLDYKDITSEATAINCAFVSGILNDFTGEEKLSPTVSGRMSSLSFEFNINLSNGELKKIVVENSQVEIDGGYEGERTLNLIEGKNYISQDFLVRQIYYPYRLWKNKVKKTIKNIFLTYTNGIFHLREYVFVDPNHYNSLVLVKQSKYTVRDGAINLETIQKILEQNLSVPEPAIAFPQADSFERVINLCELLKQKVVLSKDEVTDNYDFDKRQTNYYTDAGRYLDLIDKKSENGQIVFSLTKKGEQLFSLPLIDRQIGFAKSILSHLVFKQVLQMYLDNGESPSRDSVVEIMKGSHLYNVQSDSTFRRRSSTILGWVNWIMNLIEE